MSAGGAVVAAAVACPLDVPWSYGVSVLCCGRECCRGKAGVAGSR